MKHHVIVFRHCVRSCSSSVDLGWEDDFSYYGSDYVEDPLPSFGVPNGWCTPTALDLVERHGAKLVKQGIITDGAHVELITDDVQRNMATTLAMITGIQHGLYQAGASVTGLDTIHRKHESFASDADATGMCDWVKGDTEQRVQERLNTLPRPDLSFHRALRLLENIAGQGSVGSLTRYIPSNDTHFNYDDDWNLVGAPALLYRFGRLLFYARAGIASQRFAAGATVRDVYQLLQYVHWFRSVTCVDNNWAGVFGAPWAKMIVVALARGGLHRKPLPSSDSVTIAIAHETELDALATAFGITWDPPEYQSHPEFVPTPPSSGLHVVRDTDTGEIAVSFLYPVFHTEGLDNWETDASGPLKSTPVLWQPSATSSSFFSNETAGVVPSLESLEAHFVSRLSEYEGAKACYDSKRFSTENAVSPPSRTTVGTFGTTYQDVSAVVLPVVMSMLLVFVFSSRRRIFKRQFHDVVSSVGSSSSKTASDSTMSFESEDEVMMGEYA